MPAISKGNGNGGDDGRSVLDKDTKLLRDAKLEDVARCRDGGGGIAWRHGIEDMDALTEEVLEIVKANSGGEPDADHPEGELSQGQRVHLASSSTYLVDVGEEQTSKEESKHVQARSNQYCVCHMKVGGEPTQVSRTPPEIRRWKYHRWGLRSW